MANPICLPACSFGNWLVFGVEGDQIEQAYAGYIGNRDSCVRRAGVTRGFFQQYSGFFRSGNGGSGGRGGDVGSHNHMTYNHIVVNGVGNDCRHIRPKKRILQIETICSALEYQIRHKSSRQTYEMSSVETHFCILWHKQMEFGKKAIPLQFDFAKTSRVQTLAPM
ncbi:hypothetical protein CPB84DRAFT_1753490 [Gymnopilus junonius]|uniref:Uncharacterized protein n=1 Tax=Gymnopilus junonius TaxID=109634 RepID=A0A9P5TF15_GYMJU|nr:hypothetical protein CPB84DRAFT_1753490 [Gymnopilus junonius]